MEAGKAIALTIVALAALAGSAAAEPDDREARARTLFERAGKQRDGGDLAGALATYQSAYDLVPNPQILLNQSAIYLRLGWTDELANVSQLYIDHPDADPATSKDVARTLAALDRELAVLMLRITETGAVTIDGKPIGRAPIARKHRVAPGRHVVVLRGDAGERTATVVVEAGALRDVVLDEPIVFSGPRTGDRWYRRPSTLIAAGAGVALVAGIGLWAATDSAYDAWTAARDRTMPPASPAELSDLEASVRGRALGANLCFGVAAAATVVAGVIYYRERSRRRRADISAAIRAMPGGAMAILRVSQ